MQAPPISKGAFVRAMEPVRGKRFLAFRKNKLARRVLGLRPLCLFVELNVDILGYCTLSGFKSMDDVDGAEEYRFVGPNVPVELLHKLPPEIPTEEACTNCIRIKSGGDLKRFKPGSGLVLMEGDLYIVANDSGMVSLLKLALLGLARSAGPDGQCMFGSLFDKSTTLREPSPQISSFSKAVFRLNRLEQLQLTRSVAVLVSHVPTGSLSSILKTKVLPAQAWEMLQKPPNLQEQSQDELTCSALHLLLYLVSTSKPKPIPFPCFQLFASQAEKIKSMAKFIESDELGGMCGELLGDLHSDSAVSFIREISRVVKEWNTELIVEWAERLGPGLVDSFVKRDHLNAMVWFLSSLSQSRIRDKIFAKFNKNARTPPPPAVQSLSPDSQRSFSLSPSLIQQQSLPLVTPTLPQSVARELDFSPPPLAITPPLVTKTSQTVATTLETTPSLVILQDDLDALVRLVGYLKQRLEEEERGEDAGLIALLRSELISAERELKTHSGTNMNAMLSQLNTTRTSSFASSSSSSSFHHEPSTDKHGGDEDNDEHTETEEEEGDGHEFTHRVLELWVEARREKLMGTSVELGESIIMLQHTLEDVRRLANNVGDYPNLPPANKQTSIALVAMLEENIELRLRVLKA
ncbi:hypothetical protein BASA81_000728 [Batrachochytrium salamandrivorans]|nr:hypothetical protein BASA81_000728 [Batrachochytrium salamandrivorans]